MRANEVFRVGAGESAAWLFATAKHLRPLTGDLSVAPGFAPGYKRSVADYPDGALEASTAAPDFQLHSTPDQSVSLADFKGSPLILAFYPADWSPVCTDQMALYNQILPEFQRLGAKLAGISVDSAWCHIAFGKDRNLHFPLLADFHPKGEVAKRYGVYDENIGMAERALFVLDGEGVIAWSYVSPIGVNPGADGILTALEAMSSAEVPA
jgi:peroxiredoxin